MSSTEDLNSARVIKHHTTVSTSVEQLETALPGIGAGKDEFVRLIAGPYDPARARTRIVEWKKALAKAGITVEDDSLERVFLRYACEHALARVPSLRVHDAVKALMTRDLETHLKPRKPSDPSVDVDSYPFSVAFDMASFHRFPAGPLDWTISGMPRSWFAKIPVKDLPRSVYFIAAKMRGTKPAFYTHVAPPPRKRAMVIDKEVRKAYYRMAKSLALQPEMIGIMTASWLNDPAMLKEMPQLAAVNEPYTHLGGFITTVGPAHPTSGFLERSPERQKRYDEGTLRPMLGLAMWPRANAIRWAEEHPEFED